jgi:arylsulfatase
MQDPQERYDILMTNWTEKTWVVFRVEGELAKLKASYVKYPPRPMQSFVEDMPYTINQFREDQGLPKK